MKIPSRSWLMMLALVLPAGTAHAEPTRITVRTLSKDAKFIGSSMGGMRITLRDAETEELLATGITTGSTGDTKRIIGTPHERGTPKSDAKSAKYSVTLELNRPRLIEVTAFGPLSQRQSAVSVSSTQWIIPGKHVTGGDAWVLEIPGLVVDVLGPPNHFKLNGAPQKVQLRANVTMMCGCPIEPGGLWDANKFEVAAMMTRNGKHIGNVPLTYAGTTSQFSAEFTASEPGVYEATIYAYAPSNGNTGVDRVTFIVP